MWILTLGACGFGGPSGTEVVDLDLADAVHAVSVPLQRFAVPDSSNGRPRCTDGSVAFRGLVTYVHVQVGLDDVWVGSTPLQLGLTGGLVPTDQRRGHLVSKIYEELLESAETSKDLGMQGCTANGSDSTSHSFVGELLISVDHRVPWATVENVMYTAQQAQYSTLFFRVDATGSATATVPLPSAPSPAVTPLEMGLTHRGATYQKDGELTEVRLRHLATTVTGSQAVALSPEASLSTGEALAGFDAVAGADLPQGPFVRLGSPSAVAPAAGAFPDTTTQPLAASSMVTALVVRRAPVHDRRARSRTNTDAIVRRTGEEGRPITAARSTGHVTFGAVEPVDPPVTAVIKRYQNQLRFCYQRQLAKQPGLTRAFTVVFTVHADGSVSTVNLQDAPKDLDPVASCMVGRFKRMKFPARSAPQTYRYPMTCSPTP